MFVLKMSEFALIRGFRICFFSAKLSVYYVHYNHSSHSYSPCSFMLFVVWECTKCWLSLIMGINLFLSPQSSVPYVQITFGGLGTRNLKPRLVLLAFKNIRVILSEVRGYIDIIQPIQYHTCRPSCTRNITLPQHTKSHFVLWLHQT